MIDTDLLEQGLARKIDLGPGPLDKVSGLHKYWARKPWRVLDWFIDTYSKPGDLVLDPFMGSGSTGLQANILGRKFLGIDLNPFACFLGNQTLSPDFDRQLFEATFQKVEAMVKIPIMDLYRVEEQYVLWSKKEPGSVHSTGLMADIQFGNRLKGSFLLPAVNFDRQNLTVPDAAFPSKFFKDRFSYKGVSKVSDMYSDRNLAALSLLHDAILKSDPRMRDLLFLAFSNTLLHVSHLKSENVRPLGVNNYWMPDDYIEENVWWRFADRVAKLATAKSLIEAEFTKSPGAVRDFKILNKSCTELKDVSSSSVDYVLTDPPYGDAIQYSELSFIWNTWLGSTYENDEEVIVNPAQGKKNAEYLTLLAASLSEANRVLKKDAFATIAFHSRDIALWLGLADILRSLNMTLKSIDAFPPKGNPFTRNWAKFSPKTDLYITVSKGGQVKSLEPRTIAFSEIAALVKAQMGGRDFSVGPLYDLLVACMFSFSMSGYEITGLPTKKSIAVILSSFFE